MAEWQEHIKTGSSKAQMNDWNILNIIFKMYSNILKNYA